MLVGENLFHETQAAPVRPGTELQHVAQQAVGTYADRLTAIVKSDLVMMTRTETKP